MFRIYFSPSRQRIIVRLRPTQRKSIAGLRMANHGIAIRQGGPIVADDYRARREAGVKRSRSAGMAFLMIQPIPDGLICLTLTTASVTASLCRAAARSGFGGTFYISEGLRFLEDKTRYMKWEEIADLDAQGFEVGNHTRAHKNVNEQTPDELRADIDHIDARCRAYGITHPTTICYPGYRNGPAAVEVLRDRGFAFALRGTVPEFTYNGEGGRGPAYDPTYHDPLLVPPTGAAGPAYSLDDFKWSVDQATEGQVCVLTITAARSDHAWVHVDTDVFTTHMRYLQDNARKVTALRDLECYVPLV